MQYCNFPQTGLNVSRICLGTMMFGGQTDEAESLKIMDYAFDHGVNFFDTANGYNQGASEVIVGRGLAGRRHEIILATKVWSQMGSNPNDRGLSRYNILSGVEASLKRLNTDYIDLYYMHMPDYKTSVEESLQAMDSLVRSGKVRYIGVSNYASWQMADMLAVCDKRNLIPFVITQNVYNLLTRGIDAELVPFIQEHKIGLTIYNPIAGGLLAGKHTPGQPSEDTRFANNPGYFKRYWSNDNFDALESLKEIAKEEGMSLLEFAIFSTCRSTAGHSERVR